MESVHCKSLSWTCLTVSKTSYDSPFQKAWQKRFKSCFVNVVCSLLFVKCIVKSESVILNVFRDSVNFILRLMNFYLRICCRNCIDLPIDLLLFKNGSFSDINSQFGLSITLMGREHFFLEFVFLDHKLEINVDIFARCFVHGFFLLFFFFGLLHFETSLFPFLLNFFDGLHRVCFIFLRLVI